MDTMKLNAELELRFGPDDPPEPGVYPNVSEGEYRRWNAVNWSTLKLIKHSLEKLRDQVLHPDPDDDKYIRETMFHQFVQGLDGDRFIATPAYYPKLEKIGSGTVKEADGGRPGEYIVGAGRGGSRVEELVKVHVDDETGEARLVCANGNDDFVRDLARAATSRWNSSANYCKAWSDAMERAGKIVVDRGFRADAKAMAARVRALHAAQVLLDGAQFEVAFTWVDPATGLRCKGLADALKWPCLGELKGSRHKVSNDGFANTCKQMGYFGQVGFYLDGLTILLGRPEDHPPFVRFLACENERPFPAASWDIFDDPEVPSFCFLGYGRMLYRSYLHSLKDALDNDHWPGPCWEAPNSEPSDELTLPEWMKLDPATYGD